MSETVDTILQDRALLQEVRRKLGRGPAQRAGTAFEKSDDLRAAMQRNTGLEKVIELVGRPCYFVKNGVPEIPLGDVWGLRLASCRQALERAIRATARVEVSDSSGSWFEGTAWLIAPGLAVTNRHVALAVARRNADGTGTLRKDFKKKTFRVKLDFLEEYELDETYEVDVESIPFIAEDDDTLPDIALLKLADDSKLPPPIPLAKATPASGQEAWIVAVGYPAIDPDEDAKVRADIFKDVFDVKRVSPGVIKAMEPGDWFFKHDCSTLGGNSGSLLLDVASGGVAGLHFKGFKRLANFAINVEALRKVLEPVLKELEAELPPAPVAESNAGAEAEALEGLPAGGDEGPSTRSAAALATREGYVPSFLGHGALSIALPRRVRSRAKDAVRLKGSQETLLHYTHFSLEVSELRGLPLWTAVNVQPGNREKVRRPGWINDPRIEAEAQLGDDYYKRAKLSRGHMVRRLDPVWGEDWKQGNDDTHVFTNACPQVQSFNDGIWGDLEDFALYDRAADRKITVVTGPILSEDDPELFEVQVPIRFWKIIAFRKSGGLTAAAFVLSQEKELESSRWSPYQWTIAGLEREIDLEFGELRDADPEGALEGPPVKRRIFGPEDVRF